MRKRSVYPVAGEEQSSQRLLMFMVTRLGVATLLLGGALLIALDRDTGFDSFTPRFLLGLIAAIYALTVVFAAWLLKGRRRHLVAPTQIVWDLLMATALVYVTGGPSSGFTFLFGVAVLMAAMVLGPFPARLTGIVALSLYVALGLSLSAEWIPPPPDQAREAYALDTPTLARTLLVNAFGLMLVTLLASTLAGRLRAARGRIQAAEASAAQLARLNEDILRSLASGLITTDLHGRVRTANPWGSEMLRGKETELVGKPLAGFLPAALEPSQMAARAEGVATRLDGSRFPVGYSTNPLVNWEGDEIGAVIVFQDLTEISQLREAARRAERLAILGRLSAGLAHEIRNPLNSISGSVELVGESPGLDEQERRLLKVILSETDRLEELVNTMLQVGRPVSPQPALLDLRDMVAEVVEMARRGPAAAADIEIRADLPEEPVMGWVDGGQTRQVLWNLIKNAVQASPHKTTVQVAVHTARDGAAVLEVRDQGIGFEENQKDVLFDMFYSERTQGAGIGLALVRQIVDAHGGSVDVQSAPRAGATFRVTFPAPDPEDKVRSTDLVP